MGALHEGHLELLQKARSECDRVACSIFVNPLQFNDKRDLERYPRQQEADRQKLEKAGCHMLFIPEYEGVYKDHVTRTYDLGGLDRRWEGLSRPGHFQGMANVVERLFFYVRPDRAYFGEKDRQQLAIVKHLARSLRWPEEIVGCPTRREPDGLAMSSRNALLTREERVVAPVVYRSLHRAAAMAFSAPVKEVVQAAHAVLAAEPLFSTDYLAVVDADSLEPLADWGDRQEAVALVAVRLGAVRLIDNVTLRR